MYYTVACSHAKLAFRGHFVLLCSLGTVMHAPVRHGPQSEVRRLVPAPHISARKDSSQHGVLEHATRDEGSHGGWECGAGGEENSLKGRVG